MNNYLQRLGLTAWRKKSALLVAVGLLSLIIFGLQYVKVNEKSLIGDGGDDNPTRIIADTLIQIDNIKFVSSNRAQQLLVDAAAGRRHNNAVENFEEPSRDEIIERRRQSDDVLSGGDNLLELEHQLGIPYVNIDQSKRPYVPPRRLVHFDLKGAPPLVSYLAKIFPMIRNMGATGILLEYEDMFPYSGVLQDIAARNAYTAQQVREILKLAEKSQLEVIPLVQTFGHVEFALKHQKWAKLREVVGSPQALCPSKNDSLDFVNEIVRQIMELHPKINYLHIGCDEVFQMGECDLCRLEVHETLFLRHVRNVANNIYRKYPNLRLIIWDDMLRHLSLQNMLDVNLGKLVEPMVWVYAEDIYRFVQPTIWEKYAGVFPTVWTASAFKGAFGETLFVPDSRRHLENNLRWLDVMAQQAGNFKRGLMGIAITGWQRYDHFAVLCELLPAGIPSLALSLTAVTNGYFNSSLKSKVLSSLTCPQQQNNRNVPFINLNIDPHLWDKLGRCMFPGNSLFRLTYRLYSLESEVFDFVKLTRQQRGWMTTYNVRRNYSLPLRVDELTADLPRIYHGAIALIRSSVDAMHDVFDNYTIGEWIEQRIYPFVNQLEAIQNESIALKSVNHWAARPLPSLGDLQRFGVPPTN